MQYTKSLEGESSNIIPKKEANDSEGESLLHKALKRKRTESETENLSKRQIFIANARPNYFTSNNPPNASKQPLFSKPSLLTSALTSPPKAPRLYHLNLISNRNSLKSTHAELVSLLKSTNSTTIATSTTTAATSQIKLPSDSDDKSKSPNNDD